MNKEMFSVKILQLKQDYTVCFEDLAHRRDWDVEAGKNIGKVFQFPTSEESWSWVENRT